MKFFYSLKFKLILTITCVALIPIMFLSLLQLSQFNRTLSNNIKKQMDIIAKTNSDNFNSWIDRKVLTLENILKAHPEFSKADAVKINSILKPIRESDLELETAVFIDKDGNAISIKDNSVINLSEREYFQKARDTKKTYISDVLVSKVTGNNVITVAVPVFDESGGFQGVIFSQPAIKALENILGKINVEKTGSAFMLSTKGDYIFSKDSKRIGKNYKDYIKDKSTEKIFNDDVLSKNEGTVSYKNDDGKDVLAAYSTVPITGWKIVVEAPSGEVFKEFNQTMLSTIITILIIIILVILLSIFMSGFIAKPIKLAAAHLSNLANKDFTVEVPGKYLRRKDEVGLLAKSMDTTSKSIRSILQNIISEVHGMKDNVTVSSQNLSELVSQMEDVSATTEEMSAGMEETAASAEEMSATSTEIDSAVDSIAEKAKNGSLISKEISKRAQVLKENVLNSQKSAQDIHLDIDNDIRASIEKSKAVEQINVLTESILQITDQTNLLALNAAIEAARAGEAGRGFAVVAEEIRKLAEDSKNTANEIQQITKLVVNAVQSLTKSSEKALNFIDTTVINDYKTMVSTGEQYHKDAEAVQELVTDFSSTAEKLAVSIESMTKAINEVTISNSEEAQGTQNIAEKTSDVMQRAAKVADMMKETASSSERLAKAVAIFKI